MLPALLLNYFGQGALLMSHPELSAHPFYAMVPSWAMIPTVVLTALATIIASQAVISGAFSLTRQAIQQGYLPRLEISHTSPTQSGQIYIAPINWMLMVCTVALVAGFQSSSKLAAAYGVAVTSTMIITSILFFVVARKRWHWTLVGALSLSSLFLLVDVPFFLANLSKILHGAWFPIFIGAIFFLVMQTWAKGRRILAEQLRRIMPPVHQYIVDIISHPPHKVEGDAVFLSGTRNAVPVALAKNVQHNHVTHNRTILLHFKEEDVPWVPNREKVQTENLGGGFHRITARYGFMEDPTLKNVLSLAREQGLELKPETTSFFIGRENLVLADKPAMARWRAVLFIFLSRNAANPTSFFNLPPDRVIEVGVRLLV